MQRMSIRYDMMDMTNFLTDVHLDDFPDKISSSNAHNTFYGSPMERLPRHPLVFSFVVGYSRLIQRVGDGICIDGTMNPFPSRLYSQPSDVAGWFGRAIGGGGGVGVGLGGKWLGVGMGEMRGGEWVCDLGCDEDGWRGGKF